jgi:hypothetical protein
VCFNLSITTKADVTRRHLLGVTPSVVPVHMDTLFVNERKSVQIAGYPLRYSVLTYIDSM